MSDDSSPNINITRGSRSRKRSSSKKSASTASSSGGVNFSDVATAAASGVRNAWLAGLGAISYAETVSSQVFDTLVSEGKSWEQSRRETTEAVKQKVKSLQNSGTEVAASAEKNVEESVSKAIGEMGVPTKSEMESLRSQVDDLTAKIDRLTSALEEKKAEDA
jgi:poly(hydroxyalkanoate) granule-associated protein